MCGGAWHGGNYWCFQFSDPASYGIFCWQDTHSQHTSVQYSLFTSAERIARAWLKNCITSLCAWKESVIWSAHVSPFVALSPAVYHEHIIFPIHSYFYHDTRTRSTIGTTGSSPRTPSTSWTSPGSPSRHAAPSGITLAWKPAPCRKPAQDNSHKLWAQRACGLSQGSKIILEIHINYMMHRKKLEKKITEPRSPNKWRNLENLRHTAYRILNYQRRPYFQSHMQFRRFRGEHCRFWSRRWRVTKDADFTTVCPESFGETRCRDRAGERGNCTICSSQSKRKFEVSFIWRSESSGETKCIVFIWAGKPDREFCVQNANPWNLRGSLLEGNKDHLLNQARSDLVKQELHVESLNKCIGELQRQTEEQRLALQDAQYGFVESRRAQVRLTVDLSMKEKVLRDTQIRSMHEMGEMKRDQEQRVDEVSVQN